MRRTRLQNRLQGRPENQTNFHRSNARRSKARRNRVRQTHIRQTGREPAGWRHSSDRRLKSAARESRPFGALSRTEPTRFRQSRLRKRFFPNSGSGARPRPNSGQRGHCSFRTKRFARSGSILPGPGIPASYTRPGFSTSSIFCNRDTAENGLGK
jgi:hypothetical protein